MNEKSKRRGVSVATRRLARIPALLSALLAAGIVASMAAGCASPNPEAPIIIHAHDLIPLAPGATVTAPAPAGVRRYWLVSDRAWGLLLRLPEPATGASGGEGDR